MNIKDALIYAGCAVLLAGGLLVAHYISEKVDERKPRIQFSVPAYDALKEDIANTKRKFRGLDNKIDNVQLVSEERK